MLVSPREPGWQRPTELLPYQSNFHAVDGHCPRHGILLDRPNTVWHTRSMHAAPQVMRVLASC
jgi:hypothetical protein